MAVTVADSVRIKACTVPSPVVTLVSTSGTVAITMVTTGVRIPTVTTSWVRVGVIAAVVAVVRAVTIVNQVDVTEVPGVVAVALVIVSVRGVAGARGTLLFVGITIGTGDEAVVVLIIKTIITAFPWNKIKVPSSGQWIM